MCETILTRFDESIVDPTNEQAVTVWKTMNRKAVTGDHWITFAGNSGLVGAGV